MPTERPAQGTWLRTGRQKRARDADATGPADVIPFGPRTPADPPTAAAVTGREGRVTTRRTLSSGLSITLSINVNEIVSSLVAEEDTRLRVEEHGQPPPGKRQQRRAQNKGRSTPSSGPRTEPEASRAPDTPALDVLPHLYGRDPQRLPRFSRDLQTSVYLLLRGRAGAIVSTVVGRRRRTGPALQHLGDLHTYRSIMEAETWAGLLHAVRDTRSYEAGLDASLLLLRVTDLHQALLSRRECAVHRKWLYWGVLEMLDRLDRWDAYLETWARVRARTTYALTVHPSARQRPGAALTPYVLREDARGRGGLEVGLGVRRITGTLGYPFNRTDVSWGGGSPSCRHALSEVRGRAPGLVPNRCRLPGLPGVAAMARWLRLRGLWPRWRLAARGRALQVLRVRPPHVGDCGHDL